MGNILNRLKILGSAYLEALKGEKGFLNMVLAIGLILVVASAIVVGFLAAFKPELFHKGSSSGPAAPTIEFDPDSSAYNGKIVAGSNISFTPKLVYDSEGVITYAPVGFKDKSLQNWCIDCPKGAQKASITLNFNISNYSDKVSLTLLEMAVVGYCVVKCNGTVVLTTPPVDKATYIGVDVTGGTVATPFQLLEADAANPTAPPKNVLYPIPSNLVANSTIQKLNMEIPGLTSGLNQLTFDVAMVGAGNLYFKLQTSIAS